MAKPELEPLPDQDARNALGRTITGLVVKHSTKSNGYRSNKGFVEAVGALALALATLGADLDEKDETAMQAEFGLIYSAFVTELRERHQATRKH